MNDHVGVDFTSFKTLLHLTNPEDLVDDLDIGWALQDPLSVTNDVLKFIGSNAVGTKITDNVKQEPNAVCWK